MAGEIPIPNALRRPHSFVTATKNAVGGAEHRDDGRLDTGRWSGVVRIIVSRAQVRSALLLLQGVFREAERRGYQITAVDPRRYHSAGGVAIDVRGHKYAIEVIELTDRVPLSIEDREAWQRAEAKRLRFRWEPERKPPSGKNVANGHLCLALDQRHDGHRSNWSAGPRGGLERKLPSLFAELERRAEEDDRRAEELRERAEERRRLESERVESHRMMQVEQACTRRLFEEIAAWRGAQDVDAYVTALRSRLDRLEAEDRQRISAWCDWADEWRTRTDPTLRPDLVPGLLGDERERFEIRSQPAR